MLRILGLVRHEGNLDGERQSAALALVVLRLVVRSRTLLALPNDLWWRGIEDDAAERAFGHKSLARHGGYPFGLRARFDFSAGGVLAFGPLLLVSGQVWKERPRRLPRLSGSSRRIYLRGFGIEEQV